MFLLGSRVPGRVLLALSCRGRGGAGNWLQLALQVDAPVGELLLFSCFHGRQDSCLFLCACTRSNTSEPPL